MTKSIHKNYSQIKAWILGNSMLVKDNYEGPHIIVLCEMSRIHKSRQPECRLVVAYRWEQCVCGGEIQLEGDSQSSVCFLGLWKSSKIDCGGGCTTLWIHWRLFNLFVNFTLNGWMAWYVNCILSNSPKLKQKDVNEFP